jgi:hypothetical protein
MLLLKQSPINQSIKITQQEFNQKKALTVVKFVGMVFNLPFMAYSY